MGRISIEHDKGTIRAFAALMVPLCVWLLMMAPVQGCLSVQQDEQLMDQGDQAMSQGRFRDAATAFQDYLQRYPKGNERWKAWQRLVTINRDMHKDLDLADSLLATMYLEFKSDTTRAVQILMQQAEVSAALGDTEASLAYLEKGSSLQNLSAQQRWDLLIAQARTAFRAHRFSLTHAILAKALPLAPNPEAHAEAVHMDGQALVYLGEYTQAEHLLAGEFADLQPGPLRSRIGLSLAHIAEHQKRYADALDLIDQIRPHYPNPKALEIREQALQEKIDKTK